MSKDVPNFVYDKKRKGSTNQKAFVKANKEDIVETIKFLYKRGMWSKFHYTYWLKEAQSMTSEEDLHLWWDAIVGGAMFEKELPDDDEEKEDEDNSYRK